MTSAAPTRPPAGPAPMRPGASPMQGGAPTIDPIKILKKWKWALVAAVFVGVVLGVATNFVWGATYPFFQSTVVYEAMPPQDQTLLEAAQIDETALEQFMATQAARMLSPTVLEKVTNDPRLLSEAPKWSSQFVTDTGFDSREAMNDLEERAKANPINGTFNIQLTVTWWDRNDVAAMAGLLKDAYMAELGDAKGRDNRQRRDAIQRAIDDIKQEITNLTERRSRLIRDEDVSSISEQSGTTRGKLQLIARDRNELLLEIRRMQVQLERMNEMLNSESGVRYSDTQRAMAENRPIVQGMKNEREGLEIRLNELRRSGFLPSHREYKRIERNIAALEQQISVSIERELAGIFDAEKDMLESELRAAMAQEADLVTREEALELELQDLTRTIREINDMSNEIGALNQTLADRRSSLADLETTTSLESSGRVRVVESERIPEKRSMPKLFMTVPVGMLAMLGLVAGSILAIEFLDQRVKSTADLASMSRVKIMGSVPMAGEDPGATGKFETVFRDADQSVIAESFRQIRTGLLKALDEGGHKSCLFVSGMPGAGSTSMVTNLGFACAGIERRVLLIDANFRRPSLHRHFGVDEGPGLGDVLVGAADLDDVIREVAPNLSLLTAGTPTHRVFERLNTQPMTSLLNQMASAYDLTFLDTAPAVVAGDAKALAQRCDSLVLVARAMVEKRGMVSRINNEFSDSPATKLGIILNGVRSAAGGYMKRNIRTSTAYHSSRGKGGGKPGGGD